MAIARITSASGDGSGTGTVTATLNTSSDSNVLVVAVIEDRAGSNNTQTPTYNGTNMTQIGSEWSISTPRYYKAWYMLLASGVNSSVTCTRTSTSSEFELVCAAYSGVSQSGFPDASSLNQTGTASSVTGTVTTVADNCWGTLLYGGPGNTLTAGSGTSKVIQYDTSTILDNSGTAWTPAGSRSLTATMASEQFGYQMVSFAPSAASATQSLLSLLGVGV